MTTDVSPIADKDAFALELCAWRSAQGKGDWTQQRAADSLGVPIWTYRGWEQGKHRPSRYVLALVRKAISSKTK